MKKFAFCIIFLVFISSIGFSQDIPTLQKYVNDYANVLTSSDISRINSLAVQIERETTVEVAVLTVNTTQPMTIEEYAVRTFEKNGVGKKDKDNGILIVIAIEDRKWKLEIGYGLEPIINDAKAGLIGRTYMTTAFKEGRYGDGLYDAVDAIYKVIQNSGDTSFISEQEGYDDFGSLIIISIVILVFILGPFLFLIISSFFTPKCPKCKVRMKVARSSSECIYYRCPKCWKIIRKKRKRRRFLFFYVGGVGGGFGGGGGGGGFGGGGSGGGGASGGW
jgi:uncharacterized protein